jgi:Transposase DDE domain
MFKRHVPSRPRDEPRPPDWTDPVHGGKQLAILRRHVDSLRRDHPDEAHGNQRLFADDVVLAHLLAFFNPSIKSLRTIEDFSQTRQAHMHLSVRKICKSTHSDFLRLADPTLLQPIITRLHDEARLKGRLPTELPETLGQVLAVDGSFFPLAADVAWAVSHATNKGKKRKSARLDVHLDVATWVPEIVDVHGVGTSEAASAVLHVREGAIYVYDRGIFSFELVRTQIEVGAFFVHRMREPGERTPRFEAHEDRPLTAQDRAAGVLSDRLGRLAGSSHRTAPDVVLREVVIASPDEPDGQIRLLTNLIEVEAHILGTIYRYRWQVELFFRWLKTIANFQHLMTRDRSGILLSFYVAVIGVLLMYLFTGGKPSLYAFNMLSMAAGGGATLEEIMPILKERERRVALDKASRARRDAKKKNG